MLTDTRIHLFFNKNIDSRDTTPKLFLLGNFNDDVSLINYLNSKNMEQREALFDLSHRSYQEDSQPRIKKSSQLLSSMKEFYKHEEEDEHIHATPSTQNPAIQDSVILQETIKKKCIGCIEIEKKIYQIQHELRSERKKNLRYLKIINNKMMKEKQLQTAYGEIAQELKKRMDAANTRELSMQSLVRSYQRQAEQLKISCQQVIELNKKLAQANLQLKRADERYEQLLRARQQIIQKEQSPNGLSQLQIMNVFYEKQLVELHQKINTLESQMKLQEQELKYEKNLHHIRQSANLRKEECVKSSNSMAQLANHERTSNKSKFSDQDAEKSIRKSNKEKEGGGFQPFKPFNMSKISSIEPRNDNSQLNDIVELNKEQSFNTVREQKSSQFHSIYHSQALEINSNLLSFLKEKQSNENEEAEANQSEFYSISQVLFQDQLSKISKKPSKQLLAQVKEIQREVEKELSLSSPANSNSVSKQMKEERFFDIKQLQSIKNERDAVSKLVQTVKSLLEQVQITFQSAGKSQKLFLQMPKIQKLTQSQLRDGYNKRIQELILSSTIVEEATSKFEQHFQNILRMVKKSYERALNDQQLQLAELKSIINRQDDEKRHLGKIVQKLQEHNTRLQYKISESEESLASYNPIRDTYLRSVIKKKSSLFISRFKDEQAQCEILASNLQEIRSVEIEDYQKMVDAVTYIPKYLNQILKKRQINAGLQIDMQKDLQPQFEDIIKRTLNLLQIQISNYPQENANKKLRRASFSTKQIPEREIKSKSRSYIQLQTENARLKTTLKEKTEKVINLNQRNTLLNNQKTRLQKQVRQVQQKLQQDIKALRLQLTESKVETDKRGGRETARVGQKMNQMDSQSGQFQAFEEVIQFNNLYQDKDEQLKALKQKTEMYERELKKYKMQIRNTKKKVIYINN